MHSNGAPGYYNSATDDFVADIKIDGTRLDYGDYVTGRDSVALFSFLFLKGTVMTETKNMTANLDIIFPGTGRPMNDSSTLPIYSFDG